MKQMNMYSLKSNSSIGSISRHFDKQQEQQVSKRTAPDLSTSKNAHHTICDRLEVEREKTKREEEKTKREEIKLCCQREKTKRLSLRIQLIQEKIKKNITETSLNFCYCE